MTFQSHHTSTVYMYICMYSGRHQVLKNISFCETEAKWNVVPSPSPLYNYGTIVHTFQHMSQWANVVELPHLCSNCDLITNHQQPEAEIIEEGYKGVVLHAMVDYRPLTPKRIHVASS